MRILVTGVGGPTPRSFAQALKKYSMYSRYELIATDSNPYALGLYMPQIFSRSYLVPKAGDLDYWDTINLIVKKEEIDYAVVLPELEVLEWSKKGRDGKLPCKVLLPEYQLAEKLVDKAILCESLGEYGLTPKSFVIDRAKLNSKENITLSYPFWIRSSLGSSGLGSLKINSFEELRNWIQINPNVTQFLASEFLPGRNLGCKLLYYEGALLRSAVAERVHYIMSKVAPSGITGNTSFGRLVNAPEAFEVAKSAMEKMFEKTKSRKHGFFTVDLKEDINGKPYVTEINIRYVAFTQCYAAGGANLPEDMIRVIDNDPFFDRSFRLYQFEPGLIFLRDVDEQPVIMKESQLLKLLKL